MASKRERERVMKMEEEGEAARSRLMTIIFLLCLVIVILMISFMWFLVEYHDCEFFDVLVDKYPSGCLWVGHMSPDTDSFCTAYAAAELFKGDYAVSENPNREIEYVIRRFGLPNPPLFEDKMKENPERCVGVVDHNQQIQSPIKAYNIPRENIIAIIDHHAIQSNILTHETIIHVDVRPWGSTSTVLYELYQYSDMHPSRQAARCMVAAILSDTLGLTSPITTEWDRQAAYKLSRMGDITDLDQMYYEMGVAKSNITGYSIRQILELDKKTYILKWMDNTPCYVYWGTLETFAPSDVLDNLDAYIEELTQLKHDYKMDLMYFSVVDLFKYQKQHKTNVSSLVLIGPEETKIAIETFEAVPDPDNKHIIDLGTRVSRKADLIPLLDYYISHHTPPILTRNTRKTQTQTQTQIQTQAQAQAQAQA